MSSLEIAGRKMSDAAWKKTLLGLEENQSCLIGMEPSEPMPSAKLCRESPHRTLGHLTACQAAWISVMRGLRDGQSRAVVPINPDPLYRKLGFSSLAWRVHLDRFNSDRDEWGLILKQVDVSQEIQTRKRTYSAQTLTKRMVEHERRHLEDIGAWKIQVSTPKMSSDPARLVGVSCATCLPCL